jgi:hypothetical protein
MFNILIDTQPRPAPCPLPAPRMRDRPRRRQPGGPAGWSIAQRHAALKREDQGIFIESLGGRSPVLVNGEQVKQPWPAHQP